MTYMEQLALRLAQERKARGISQTEMVQRINRFLGTKSHFTIIAKIEHGKRPLSINEAQAWCEAVGLRLSDLIAVMDDGKPLVTVPKTVEVGGRTYVLKEDA